jgi:hypothetical protein
VARRFWAVAVGSALLVALMAGSATAKGASWIRVQGPGLAKPLILFPVGPSDPLWPLMVDTGFWAEVCHTGSCTPGSVRSGRPSANLGPRYTLTYRMNLVPGGRDIVQYVYPFAWPRPVSYMPPGQKTWQGSNGPTDGGWYGAPARLRWVWADLGLPATLTDAMRTPSASPAPTKAIAHGGSLVPWIAVLAVVVAGAAGMAFLGVRRRPRHAVPGTEY